MASRKGQRDADLYATAQLALLPLLKTPAAALVNVELVGQDVRRAARLGRAPQANTTTGHITPQQPDKLCCSPQVI